MNITFQVPVSSNMKIESWSFNGGFRTLEQFYTIKSIVESNEFAFSCLSRVFESENNEIYKGSFTFTYYTKDGKLHSDKINSNGIIIRSLEG